MNDEKVILIEDCRFQGSITRDLLEKNGFTTKWVLTGEEALENNLYENYDIVVLDVVLPGIDGYELCKKIKASKRIIPIIMLTSMENEECVIKALNSGADDYIKKPHNNQEFIARINVQLRTARLQKQLIEKNKELEEANKLIKQLAITDMLTGAHNRAFIPEYIKHISSEINDKKISLATIMIDIDNFKSVNDTYGHLIGDVVLKSLSNTCKAEVKDRGVVVRFGGEEFLIIIDKNPLIAQEIAESIRQQFEISCPCGFKVTISLGVCMEEIDKSNLINDFEKSIKNADTMLYVSKRSGKNKVTMYKC
ncbi:MAG: diguanylate cyclase [Clostridium sp.]|uniref:diguanylate cyclase n=1 Tax=Clostridium sp. TaxID=1506 RepID=UPI002FCB6C17